MKGAADAIAALAAMVAVDEACAAELLALPASLRTLQALHADSGR